MVERKDDVSKEQLRRTARVWGLPGSDKVKRTLPPESDFFVDPRTGIKYKRLPELSAANLKSRMSRKH